LANGHTNMKKSIAIAAVCAAGLLAIALAWYANFKTELDTVKPQTPQAPFPYRAEDFEITAANGTDVIGGTLTVPHGLQLFGNAGAGQRPIDSAGEFETADTSVHR